MSDLPLPASLVMSLLSGVAAFFATWGSLRTRIAEIERRLTRIEDTQTATAKAVSDASTLLVTTSKRVSDFAELKTNTVSREVFAIRMSAQDAVLDELRRAVDRKASISTMQAVTEPLPPMRPRLPSRRGSEK